MNWKHLISFYQNSNAWTKKVKVKYNQMEGQGRLTKMVMLIYAPQYWSI